MTSMIRKISIPFARLTLFAIYFWFGLLKVLGESPASEMVKSVFDLTLHKTLPSLDFGHFIIAFGIFEILIGVLFLIKFDKLGFGLLLLHLLTTVIPLFMAGDSVWIKNLIPTLEGQYIIKNLAILGLSFFIFSRQ